ncbi:MAG: electron transfer flavoprotein subunit beta/FixA family protein [Pseudomonadota bacterium]
MQIYVCIKHVPDTAANIRPLGGPAFDETIKFIINPYDEHALEQALRIREEKGGSEVIAVTAGKEAAAGTLRSALAMGADRGILVKTDTYFTDSLETSRLLKRAIELDGSPGLIFTGKQSVDTEGMQLPFRLAAFLDLPVVVDVVAFSMAGGVVTVEREGEGGVREVIEMTAPCIVGAAKGLNRPRCPTLPEMMKARKKDIKIIDRADLHIPLAPPTVEILELQAAPDRGRGTILKDRPENIVRELLHLLREEAQVL